MVQDRRRILGRQAFFDIGRGADVPGACLVRKVRTENQPVGPQRSNRRAQCGRVVMPDGVVPEPAGGILRRLRTLRSLPLGDLSVRTLQHHR
ncbi:Uncharacterised protein [Mycobacteroides abscessus subsp. abscessus]|nr:Uncharacterised protein [Mycobacteroides abscessus subsp. abscessus]